MAQGCSIPCDLRGVEGRIRSRALKRTMQPLLPVIGAGIVLALASPLLIPFAGWEAALVAAVFFLAGTAVVAARGFLQAGEFSRLAVPAELERIVDEHEAEIFPNRLAGLRSRAASLRYDIEAPRQRVGEFLQELRETTGEAWRCPCKKRRLPLPF
jgi:hypothetical protein